MNSRQKTKRNHSSRIANNKTVCPECGERGKHFVGTQHHKVAGANYPSWLNGFWTCSKFYDPVTGRRIDIINGEILPYGEGLLSFSDTDMKLLFKDANVDNS